MSSFPHMKVCTSAQEDQRKQWVGSSPYVGDLTSTGIVVPARHTRSQKSRYLFRLCGFQVQANESALIKSLHQMAYIGVSVRAEESAKEDLWYLERPVVDPLWSFPDGNISWHLRVLGAGDIDRWCRDPHTGPGTPVGSAPRAMSFDSALLNLGGGGGGYTPPNSGLPYGQELCPGLGTWRDMRFPWGSHSGLGDGIPVKGPAIVVMFASVYQTNVEARPNRPPIVDTSGLREEDLFLLAHPGSRYTRVGGRMEVLFSPKPIPEKDQKRLKG